MKWECTDKYSKLIALLCNLPLFFHNPGSPCPRYLRNCHHPSVLRLLISKDKSFGELPRGHYNYQSMRVAVPQGLICPSSQMEIQLSGRTWWQRKCIHPATKNNFSMDLFALRSLNVIGRDCHHFLSTELKGVKEFLWKDNIQSLARGRSGSKETTGRQTRISQIHVESICPTDFGTLQYSAQYSWNPLNSQCSWNQLWIQLNHCTFFFVLSQLDWFGLL